MGDQSPSSGLRRRMGPRLFGWRLLFTLITVAVVVLPTLVVWALVDSDLWATVLGAMIAIVLCLAVIVMSAGTKYSGDW